MGWEESAVVRARWSSATADDWGPLQPDTGRDGGEQPGAQVDAAAVWRRLPARRRWARVVARLARSVTSPLLGAAQLGTQRQR
jgi:hypothetical protein